VVEADLDRIRVAGPRSVAEAESSVLSDPDSSRDRDEHIAGSPVVIRREPEEHRSIEEGTGLNGEAPVMSYVPCITQKMGR
jgi:hypothetical protein